MSNVLSLTSVPVANVLASIPLASIPSPSVSYLQLGPFRVHFYALCILAGMAVCLWLGSRRWKAAGGTPERVFDVAMWAI
ncbi:prolipoprotein diacylglyceryl transferase family protein, partial [uncultured Rothia sp.]|uniref:prolipoprotein diacylglyceryl transferase family protein n=1 Tax=uncultured Rothia sp. TaxID=316088 RepID=UPI002619C616